MQGGCADPLRLGRRPGTGRKGWRRANSCAVIPSRRPTTARAIPNRGTAKSSSGCSTSTRSDRIGRAATRTNPDYAYISRAEKVQGSDEVRSYKIRATRSYPYSLFKYEDEQGWLVRKYEPYCKPETTANGRPGRNLKFTWWYQETASASDMHTRIYGDNDVMRALKEYNGSADVVQTDDTRAPLTDKSYYLTVGDQDVENKRKVFDKIIICSGPRDALATYFHSDAHVVWPHSETTMIPEHVMRKLFAISDKLYVMYDLDETGERAMNELGMMYLRPQAHRPAGGFGELYRPTHRQAVQGCRTVLQQLRRIPLTADASPT